MWLNSLRCLNFVWTCSFEHIADRTFHDLKITENKVSITAFNTDPWILLVRLRLRWSAERKLLRELVDYLFLTVLEAIYLLVVNVAQREQRQHAHDDNEDEDNAEVVPQVAVVNQKDALNVQLDGRALRDRRRRVRDHLATGSLQSPNMMDDRIDMV